MALTDNVDASATEKEKKGTFPAFRSRRHRKQTKAVQVGDGDSSISTHPSLPHKDLIAHTNKFLYIHV
jgi:hypothetical protein